MGMRTWDAHAQEDVTVFGKPIGTAPQWLHVATALAAVCVACSMLALYLLNETSCERTVNWTVAACVLANAALLTWALAGRGA